MKSLIVGMGFGGLYYGELTKLGHNITTVDADPSKKADYLSVDDLPTDLIFDTVNICTPNFTHEVIARKVATKARIVFVEKPGVKTAANWKRLVEDFPATQFMMVKNNQYRDNILSLIKYSHSSIIVDLNWINADRVPNPGTWFTTKEKAFGGVSRDLMPHLLSLFIACCPDYDKAQQLSYGASRRWKLEDLTRSDYGIVKADGVYDVDDACKFSFKLGDTVWNLTADWRSMGPDQRNIQFTVLDSAPKITRELGLCPEEAYNSMIRTAISKVDDDVFWAEQLKQDMWIHEKLDQL